LGFPNLGMVMRGDCTMLMACGGVACTTVLDRRLFRSDHM